MENKQKFIGQLMSGKNPSRSCEDVDEAALSYAEVKALASGDPRIIEMTDLDSQVTKLKLLKANHEGQRYMLEDRLIQFSPRLSSAGRNKSRAWKKILPTCRHTPRIKITSLSLWPGNFTRSARRQVRQSSKPAHK